MPQCFKNKDDAKVNNNAKKINIRSPRTMIQDVSMKSVNMRQNSIEVEIESESNAKMILMYVLFIYLFIVYILLICFPGKTCDFDYQN